MGVGDEHAEQVDQIYSDAGNSICHSCCTVLPIFQHQHQSQQQQSIRHHARHTQHSRRRSGKDYGPLGRDQLKVLQAGQHYEQPRTGVIKHLGLGVVVEVLPQGMADVRLVSQVLEVDPGRESAGSPGDDDSYQRSNVSRLQCKNGEKKDKRAHHSIDDAKHCLCGSDCLLGLKHLLIIMKQEQSILEWASHVLEQRVVSLKAIQDVQFVRNFLFRIDPEYFNEWEGGAGQQSYTHVLERIGQYFRQEISTDISPQLAALNVYRNPGEVWQLLLGIAIKGNNRNNNINIIFELDHSMQAELVTTVTNIIDKFGQGTARIDQEEVVQEGSDRQVAIELLQENEGLREECRRLEEELLRERQEKVLNASARKELEDSLEMMRLEKCSFLEIIANVNQSNSKIFQDGAGELHSQANLSELAQDIVQFISQQRNKCNQASDRATALEEQVKELQEDVALCSEQNQLYLEKLADFKHYEREIEELRTQLHEKDEDNLAMLEQINLLEDEKFNLQYRLQRKNIEEPEMQQEQQQAQQQQRQTEKANQNNKQGIKRISKRPTLNGQILAESGHSSDGAKDFAYTSVVSEKDVRKMDDQLREPQLRNKLQREVLYLKKNVSALTRQVEALKKANEGLQKSARAFMEGNQRVVSRWEDDYESLLQKMAELSKLNEGLQQEGQGSKEALAQAQKEKEKTAQKLVEMQGKLKAKKSVHFEDEEEPQISIRISGPGQTLASVDKVKKDKVGLWDEIVKKLREIIRQGKSKELSYQSALLALRNQNYRLLEQLKNRKQEKQEGEASERIANNLQQSFFGKLERVESQEMRESRESRVRLVPPKLMSYVEIQQGQELDEEEASFAQARLRSRFYNVNSRIVNDFDQKPQQSRISRNQDYYAELDRRLSRSIRDGIQEGSKVEDTGTVELQGKFDEEITRINKQYNKLNINYQAAFGKLHLYTESLKAQQNVQKGYEEVLEEIAKTQAEVNANRQDELVRLRVANQALRQQFVETVIEKEDIAKQISELAAKIKERQGQSARSALIEVERAVAEVSARFSESLRDPLTLLESYGESSQDGQVQKFYRLFLKERAKSKQLGEQLQLLSCVLLQCRNMIV